LLLGNNLEGAAGVALKVWRLLDAGLNLTSENYFYALGFANVADGHGGRRHQAHLFGIPGQAKPNSDRYAGLNNGDQAIDHGNQLTCLSHRIECYGFNICYRSLKPSSRFVAHSKTACPVLIHDFYRSLQQALCRKSRPSGC
jgi:hypothetical protein